MQQWRDDSQSFALPRTILLCCELSICHSRMEQQHLKGIEGISVEFAHTLPSHTGVRVV